MTGLHEMDAGDLEFPDAAFDTVVAMYVMTVVPEPEQVMRELSRVTKPGGEVMLVNHFSQREGMRGWVERRMAPFADRIGWRSVFDVSRVTICDDLQLVETQVAAAARALHDAALQEARGCRPPHPSRRGRQRPHSAAPLRQARRSRQAGCTRRLAWVPLYSGMTSERRQAPSTPNRHPGAGRDVVSRLKCNGLKSFQKTSAGVLKPRHRLGVAL